MSKSLIISDVTKYYGNFKAIDGMSLSIQPGEFSRCWASGCGKTTLLRMIAGFNTIESGTISFDDEVINDIPAYKRNIGMVFQNYAIFPHMSVFENVTYGLKARKLERDEIVRKVNEVLALVKMSEYRDRQPQQLSGGQQQRIALARAIVINPAILLMDEPLSNLDAKLRVEMRSVIKKIQKQLGITTVYVTHDQQEALAISDRIAVMKNGVIQHVGTPHEIYMRPMNAFVANFIGISNFLRCTVSDHKVRLNERTTLQRPAKTGYSGEAILSVRPEEVLLCPPGDGKLQGEIRFLTFLGDFINYEIELENTQTIQVNEYMKDCHTLRNIGDNVGLAFAEDRINLFDRTGTEALPL